MDGIVAKQVSGQSRVEEKTTGGGCFPIDVSVSVIAHDAMPTLLACLRGLDDNRCPHDQITVYDVASTDGSGAWLAEHYPSVTVVRLPENFGPNPARNLAVTQADTPFALLIDADVQLLPGTVAELYKLIEGDESVAIATPVVLYADQPDTVQYEGTWVHYLAEASADVDDKPLDALKGVIQQVGLASGCAPLIRVSAAKQVGLFEERYFFGKTDGEFAYRVNVGGYSIIESAATQVLHHHRKRGSKYFKHQVANRWHFMLKDFQWRTLLAICPVLLVHEPALFVLLLVKGKVGEYFKAVAVLCRMLPTLTGDRRRVRAMRRMHDWQVLRGDRLVIPGDLSRSPIGRLVKGYAWLLAVYWALVSQVLRWASASIPDDRR